MTRKVIKDLAKCKVEGMCARDKLATRYLAARIDVYERRMQTLNEKFRQEEDLPPCPPDCSIPITAEVIDNE